MPLNVNIHLYLVAPDERREKVLIEVNSFQTTEVSPARQQCRAASSPLRAVCAPLATAVKTRSQPALVNASCWRVRWWSPVDTRASPTHIARPPAGMSVLPLQVNDARLTPQTAGQRVMVHPGIYATDVNDFICKKPPKRISR
jgi:hypothetical protein